MAETGTQTPVVELAAFEACDLNAPIAGVDQVGMPAISTAYGQASAAAASPAKDVYLLLSAVAGIHLRPSDPGNKFGPGAQRADLRTMIPSDIRGPQADVLKAFCGRSDTLRCAPASRTSSGRAIGARRPWQESPSTPIAIASRV